jgi:hypothetical protein
MDSDLSKGKGELSRRCTEVGAKYSSYQIEYDVGGLRVRDSSGGGEECRRRVKEDGEQPPRLGIALPKVK